MAKRPKTPKNVEALRHTDDKRVNIPTAEHQSVLEVTHRTPKDVRYPRNPDLDPQLVWRGKDYQDSSDLVVHAPPLYIQEKIHPKVLIDDLLQESRQSRPSEPGSQIDLFSDFNGVAEGADRTDFYQHDQNWTNRLILGDSLQVMASLAEREGLRGRVQCIYLDPPYGIKFNSNFQWSTTSRDVNDGSLAHITREPEQVKAFRDTWRDGVNSYLTYLRDRFVLARDLLADSGSLFVQIGDENVHRVRCVLDEVFGEANCVSELLVKKKGSQKGGGLAPVNDYILWYGRSAKSTGRVKVRPLYELRDTRELVDDFPMVELSPGTRVRLTDLESRDAFRYGANLDALKERYPEARLFAANPLKSGGTRRQQSLDFLFQGRRFPIKPGQCWKHTVVDDSGHTPGMLRLAMANRLLPQQTDVRFVRFTPEPSIRELSNWWDGLGGAQNQVYVVQTNERVVQRCVLLSTDPGDIVLDPTCGSGTTAFVAEQWGRRWITIDSSRVALALARARLMGARFPYYYLRDSSAGARHLARLTGRPPAAGPFFNNVRHGFVYEQVANVTSGAIANNSEIELIWHAHAPRIRAALDELNHVLRTHRVRYRPTVGGRAGQEIRFDAPPTATFTMPSGEDVAAASLLEWEVPRETPSTWPADTGAPLEGFWAAWRARQAAIETAIQTNADSESLYDRPLSDPNTVRVAGPFTVESLSPHRTLAVDHDDEVIDPLRTMDTDTRFDQRFEQVILENLRTAGVQQAHKEGRIHFTSLTLWPGTMVCADGHYSEGDETKRAAIFIGPEFGTVTRSDLVAAAREAGDGGFDVLVACAFNYEAYASEFNRLGRIPVLKARMNADLHMGGELKATGKGNLFVVFGEPDIDVLHLDDRTIRLQIKGVDVFDPSSGEVRSHGADGIACWFIDTNYNEESFFVRHAYFLGQSDPYGALRASLHSEIEPEAWAALHSDISRPFSIPKSGRIAVKVINHLGDEVMKVFRID